MVIGLEAGPVSCWVAPCLESFGHDVVVCNPRRVRLIAESRLKNDRVDAEVLARLVRADRRLLRPVALRSEATRQLRARLRVRRVLVESRTRCVNAARGLLLSFGHHIGGHGPAAVLGWLDRADIPAELRIALEPLVAMITKANEQLAFLESDLEEAAAALDPVPRLREIPGVGLITSLSFVLCVEDPRRFARSRDVAPYLGLVPQLHASGPRSRSGRITKEGDRELRQVLVQAAHQLFRARRETAIRKWGMAVAARSGKKKAAVAVARKLALVMHRMWVSGERFEAFPGTSDLAKAS
jgi:transposase